MRGLHIMFIRVAATKKKIFKTFLFSMLYLKLPSGLFIFPGGCALRKIKLVLLYSLLWFNYYRFFVCFFGAGCYSIRFSAINLNKIIYLFFSIFFFFMLGVLIDRCGEFYSPY